MTDDLAPIRFVDERTIRDVAAAAFERHHAAIMAALPGADVRHIGSTSVPGSLTKGDVDLVVRVHAAEFEHAESSLATVYARNTGSMRSPTFAAFEDKVGTPDIGVQLVTIGSTYDTFHTQRDALLANPALLASYNDLKQRYDGRPHMEYRAAKSAFWAAAGFGE